MEEIRAEEQQTCGKRSQNLETSFVFRSTTIQMDFSCGNHSNPLSVSLSQQYLLCLRGESGEAYLHVSNTNKYLLHQRKFSAAALLWLCMHKRNSLGEAEEEPWLQAQLSSPGCERSRRTGRFPG